MTFFTVGHSTRETSELARIVRDAGVELIVDVRRFPGSRRNPHLSREALQKSLPELGIAYEWWGETLGGRREDTAQTSRHPAWRNAAFQGYADYMDSQDFRDSLAELVARGDEIPLAYMCAETLWWRCHRRLISDALVLAGHEVVHLLDLDKSQPHVLHESVRLDEDGRPTYDVGVNAELF